jgi:hypothetical protein
MNPARNARSSIAPAPITAAVLTYIPDLAGYFHQRLEVLKLSLTSLIVNTHAPYDLMVLDNGSCRQVINYLTEIYQKGLIDYLFLSSKNLGVQEGLRFLVKNAPGDYIAYANDDVYYSSGWLNEHMKIIDVFPNVGMVSGAPVGISSETAVSSLNKLLENPPTQLTVAERARTLTWERDWAVSTGRDPEEHVENIHEQPQVVLEIEGIKAVGAAVHFQFVAPRDVIQAALPESKREQLMGGMVELDHQVDRLGLLRLSTSDRLTRHIGNLIEGDLREKAAALDLQLERQINKRIQTHWLLKIPGMGRLLRKVYNQLFKILHHLE